jgi:hypothetical protein
MARPLKRGLGEHREKRGGQNHDGVEEIHLENIQHSTFNIEPPTRLPSAWILLGVGR